MNDCPHGLCDTSGRVRASTGRCIYCQEEAGRQEEVSFPNPPVAGAWYLLGPQKLLISHVEETSAPSRSNPGECIPGGTDGWCVDFRYSPTGQQYRRFIAREEG